MKKEFLIKRTVSSLSGAPPVEPKDLKVIATMKLAKELFGPGSLPRRFVTDARVGDFFVWRREGVAGTILYTEVTRLK